MKDSTTDRAPSLFVGHGAPTLALDQRKGEPLAAFGRDIPRPKGILVASAHWDRTPVVVGATETLPLIYDFRGFRENCTMSSIRHQVRRSWQTRFRGYSARRRSAVTGGAVSTTVCGRHWYTCIQVPMYRFYRFRCRRVLAPPEYTSWPESCVH